MSSISIIEAKITSIRKYLGILKQYKKYSIEDIEDDMMRKGSLERYLYLVTQAAIDLAEAIIAFKEFRRPTTYGESFSILEEENFISLELSKKLVNMTKFRNIIAHDYENVDFQIVFDAARNNLADIEKFLDKIREKLNLK